MSLSGTTSGISTPMHPIGALPASFWSDVGSLGLRPSQPTPAQPLPIPPLPPALPARDGLDLSASPVTSPNQTAVLHSGRYLASALASADEPDFNIATALSARLVAPNPVRMSVLPPAPPDLPLSRRLQALADRTFRELGVATVVDQWAGCAIAWLHRAARLLHQESLVIDADLHTLGEHAKAFLSSCDLSEPCSMQLPPREAAGGFVAPAASAQPSVLKFSWLAACVAAPSVNTSFKQLFSRRLRLEYALVADPTLRVAAIQTQSRQDEATRAASLSSGSEFAFRRPHSDSRSVFSGDSRVNDAEFRAYMIRLLERWGIPGGGPAGRTFFETETDLDSRGTLPPASLMLVHLFGAIVSAAAAPSYGASIYSWMARSFQDITDASTFADSVGVGPTMRRGRATATIVLCHRMLGPSSCFPAPTSYFFVVLRGPPTGSVGDPATGTEGTLPVGDTIFYTRPGRMSLFEALALYVYLHHVHLHNLLDAVPLDADSLRLVRADLRPSAPPLLF